MLLLSLFPKHVRDQLIGAQQVHTPSKKTHKGSTPNGVKAYLTNPDAMSGKVEQMEDGKPSRPIAELFPATNIMFGDVSYQVSGARFVKTLSKLIRFLVLPT